MAIIKTDGSLSGMIGNGVVRNYDGLNVLSAKPDEVHNPRTWNQQTNRLKMRNVINMYGAMKGALRDNFQGKTGRQSDYSRFQACNLPQPPVYLAYDVCNCSVVAPYIVSFGTLPVIEYRMEDGWLVSGVRAGRELTMDSSVMDLSDYLVDNGDVFKRGDRVELIACYQDVTDGFPWVRCSYCEFTVDTKDRMPLRQVFNGFELRVNERNEVCFGREGACGLAIVRRRGEGRGALTSVQMLVVENPVLGKYMSEEYMREAIYSYAGKK